jgi:hypothetical protein
MDDTYRRAPLLLLAGRANRPLAMEIGELIGKSPDAATIKQFADGEIFVRIDRNARGRDVYIVQPTTAPADNMVEGQPRPHRLPAHSGRCGGRDGRSAATDRYPGGREAGRR